jgi:hypothetical protein
MRKIKQDNMILNYSGTKCNTEECSQRRPPEKLTFELRFKEEKDVSE